MFPEEKFKILIFNCDSPVFINEIKGKRQKKSYKIKYF